MSRTGRKRGVKYRGGIGSYLKAKNDITAWTREDRNPDARFTTMFDLFRLPNNFPCYEEAKRTPDPYQRVQTLEDTLRDDISDWRFVPYIQLHEFEALLLCDPQNLDAQFPDRSNEIRELAEKISTFDSPEHVNDGPDTAPSKRIIDVIPEYKEGKHRRVRSWPRRSDSPPCDRIAVISANGWTSWRPCLKEYARALVWCLTNSIN